jgi:hypothetical protein
MTLLKQSIIIATLVVALISCARSSPPPPKLTIELSNLTLCQGWNAETEPILYPDPVPSGETRLCICGQLETNRQWDIWLQVNWSRDGNRLLSNPQAFENGPFLTCIGKDEGFEPGNYVVTATVEKREVGRVEFIVGEE